jgi:hypothetical protein
MAGFAPTAGGLPRTAMVKGKLFRGNPTLAIRPLDARGVGAGGFAGGGRLTISAARL